MGGARKISAELPVPEDGGLFHGGPLTNRKKDTGGVGEHPVMYFSTGVLELEEEECRQSKRLS